MPDLKHITDPTHVGFLGYSTNEFGTKVSVHVCDSCGALFTVCPETSEESFGTGCLAETCDSYDVSRDVDLMFEIEPWQIQREDGDE